MCAKSALRENWTPAVFATVVFMFVVYFFTGSSVFFPTRVELAFASLSALSIFLVCAPLAFGYSNALRLLYSRADARVTSNMFKIPLSFYFDVVWTIFYMSVKIILWTLCFIIPGVIKSLAYAMTPYILFDEPQLNAGEAIAKSARMMHGHKTELLLLELSFIGWIILGVLSFGIGLFWVEPYMQCSIAAFYEDVKAEFEERN